MSRGVARRGLGTWLGVALLMGATAGGAGAQSLFSAGGADDSESKTARFINWEQQSTMVERLDAILHR